MPRSQRQTLRRGHGEGTIFQRADGRWVARLSFGRDRSGKRLQKTVYGVTQREALEKLHALRVMRQQAGKLILSRESLEAFLNVWLTSHVEIHRAGKTIQEYRSVTKKYITPELGSLPLVKIDVERVADCQAQLARAGASANVRRRALRVLQIELNHAVKLRKLVANPCIGFDAPRHRRKQVTVLQPSECLALFEVCRQHRLGELIIVAGLTGLRKGELFALNWSDVDLGRQIVNVRTTLEELPSGVRIKEPKSESGRRTVAMPDAVVRAFKDRLRKAAEEGLSPARCACVFPNRIGGYLRSSNFDRSVWHPLRQQAGLPETFVFHDLRHCAASLLLAAGVDLKTIQIQLGHSDYSITANTYSHLLPNAQAPAAHKLNNLLEQVRPAASVDLSTSHSQDTG